MKIQSGIIVLVILLAACTSKEQPQSDNESFVENPNQVLYDQVMDVHDEVMPEMDEIMRLKRKIKEEIANTPDMVVERKAELEKIISNLDSASRAMMDWMHKFNPLPDSADQEKAREYLESEMEQIKKVKTRMLESIDKARQEAGKQ